MYDGWSIVFAYLSYLYRVTEDAFGFDHPILDMCEDLMYDYDDKVDRVFW